MKRDEQIQKSKLKIINAALEEFGQNDYFTASTNTICKKYGISKGLLFHYYSSKDELFMVCVKICFNELSSHIESSSNSFCGTIEEVLRQYMECRMNFFKDNLYYKKIFHTATFNPPANLISEIDVAREGLNQVNKLFLRKTLDGLKLKPGVDKDSVINVIMDFGNFILSKGKPNVNADEDFMQEPVDEFIQMMKMLFYGIVEE